ncbi:MAG: hypothetical protein VX619_04295 [bacterium]|nr:hypothetical protein [bacterium]
MLLRLQGSWRDRLFVILIRTLVIFCAALLLFSPRFESVHKEWKDPVFLVLEDDSASVRLNSESKTDKDLLGRELSSTGRVLFKRFSDSNSSDPYSINTNLRDASKIKELRGIFLLSDGQEISKKEVNNFSIPIFPIPQGFSKTKDHWVKLDQVPQKIHLGQKIIMKGLVGRSVDVASMRSKTVKLRFSMDNLGIAEKIVKFDTNEREAEFEQEIYFDKAGDILFSVDLEVSDEDAIRVNNRSQFRIQVHNERRKVVLISNEIGLDKAFYTRILRRNPALDVKTLYTRAKYPDSRRDPCAQLHNTELFILHTLDDKFFSECIESKYLDIPRIHLVDLNNVNVFGDQISDFIDIKKIRKSSIKQADWSYRLDSINFPALKLYEHEAFERTLLSSLPEIEVPAIRFHTKAGIISPFFLKSAEEKFPLLLVEEGSSPVRALFTSTELHRTSFAPWARDEQKKFMISLFQRLVNWMMDYEKVRGLNVFIPKTSFSEGEMFLMELDGDSSIRWNIKNADSPPQILHSGTSPVRFKQILPVGSYYLTIDRSGTEILKRYIHVDFDHREFKSLGVNNEKLRNLASLSNGKWLERDDNVNVQTVLDELPGNLLQKKLKLKRSQVDLQKNTYLALFMMLLLSLEWVYRLMRKMV